MDKLIELLNEYEDWMVSWVKEYSEEFGVFVLNTEQMIEEEIIISKSFGFIKWLVENDKIDFDKRDLKDRFMNEFERYPQFQNNTTNREFNINGLLMLLSIQDNPIQFLCDILK